MLIGYKRGQGSIILRVKILNSSVSTGAGLTGLTHSSTGLIISTIADNESTATAYTVGGSNVETITTLGTFAAPTSGKCRFKEVDSTNHKGVYEIQIADARYAVSSAKSLLVSICGATNAAECDVVIPLRDLDPYDAVRAGLTALPNVASGNSGAIPTVGTGTAQISLSSGQVILQSGTGTGQLSFTSGILKVDLDTIKTNPVVNGGTVTFPSNATLASTTNITAGTITTATNLTNLPAITANWLTAAGLATDAVQEIRDAITGGAYALSTDSNGRIRIVDGTGAGEINTNAGAIALVDLVTDITTKTGFRLSATGVDDIWDEATSGHVTSGTFGQRFAVVRANTAQAGANGSITLDASASATDDFYNNNLLFITGGTGAGQARFIEDYTGSSKVASVSPNWVTNPSSDSVFVILPFDTLPGASAPSAAEVAVAVRDVANGSGAAAVGSLGEVCYQAMIVAAEASGYSQNIIAKLGSWTGSGSNTVLGAIKALASKTASTPSDIGGTFDASTDSVEALRDRGDAAYTTATGFSTHSASDVWSVGTRTLTALGFALGASDLSSGTITAAKFAAGAIDAASTSADFVTEIRNAITGGAYALSTDSNGMVRIVDGTGSGELNTSGGYIAGIAGTINTLDALDTAQDTQHATTQGLISALNNLSAAQVLAQAEAALATTTRSLPGQVTPSTTPTLVEAVMQLFQQHTNPTDQNSTTQKIYNRAGNTVHQKRTVSDDGTTATLGALVTGP